jgi:hypothetical protein
LEKSWQSSANTNSGQAHRTVSGAPGWPTGTGCSRENNPGVWLKFTGLSGGATDCPVNQRRQRTTVGRAINARHVAHANGRLGTPDYPMCTGQCPVRQPIPRTNGRMRQIWKEIVHWTATVTIRWCTVLSGAPLDKRQEMPSKIDLQRLLAALGL